MEPLLSLALLYLAVGMGIAAWCAPELTHFQSLYLVLNWPWFAAVAARAWVAPRLSRVEVALLTRVLGWCVRRLERRGCSVSLY